MNWKTVILWHTASESITIKDQLNQKMLHDFMSSSQARWANTSDRITSLTFSGVFLFCIPIHTSVAEVPVWFFTMVSQCYHHDITLSHFLPMAVTVSADIWICQHKLLWIHHGKLLRKVSRLGLLPKTFYLFHFNGTLWVVSERTQQLLYSLLHCKCCLSFM